MSQTGVTEVGKYRIIEQIGEGAMGVVYRALDPVLNRMVAIKVMSDSLARDDDLRSRFLREAQAAGSLQHPNVVTIYDFGEVSGHLFIAMEFVAGNDLEALIRAGSPMTIVDKIDILVDVLGGLGYAHKHGVVHRDVKPANIRVDEEGRARIMDFGIAYLQSSKLTRTGIMVGTPAYMAPEQVTGGVITPQTDIFSVGAVMYELFTGSKPFEGESLHSVFYKIVSQAPPELAALAPNLPESLNVIAMRALAKDPAERYATASEMAAELAEARGRLDSVLSQPTTLSLRSSITNGLSSRATQSIPTRQSRSRLVVAGVAGGVVLLAGVGIAMTLASRRTDQAPQPSAAPTPQIVSQAPTVVPAPSEPAPVQPSGAAAPTTSAAKTPTPTTTTTQQSPKSEPVVATARELALVRTAQASALEARRRASQAGATAEQLRTGDDHSLAANSAALQGKAADAVAHLNLANTAWTNVERDIRAAAAAATAGARTRAEAPKQEIVPTPPPVVTSTPATAQQPAAQAAPVRPTAANPSTEIGTVVEAYERAIGSRDVAELRRAYPGMTTAQSKGWEDFFKSLRSISATLSMDGLDVRGDAADARVTGAYDYVTTAGKSTRQPVSFQAAFRREGGAWRLIAVR